ncbi:hypothetical protein BDV06DRAFT_189673, partial [Aspergillus oleicola]
MRRKTLASVVLRASGTRCRLRSQRGRCRLKNIGVEVVLNESRGGLEVFLVSAIRVGSWPMSRQPGGRKSQRMILEGLIISRKAMDVSV